MFSLIHVEHKISALRWEFFVHGPYQKLYHDFLEKLLKNPYGGFLRKNPHREFLESWVLAHGFKKFPIGVFWLKTFVRTPTFIMMIMMSIKISWFISFTLGFHELCKSINRYGDVLVSILGHIKRAHEVNSMTWPWCKISWCLLLWTRHIAWGWTGIGFKGGTTAGQIDEFLFAQATQAAVLFAM